MLSPANTIHDSNSSLGHLAFLRRATQDDQFRAALKADPQAGLAEYGLHVDSEQIPPMVRVPSAESILDALVDVENDDVARERSHWFGFLGSS